VDVIDTSTFGAPEATVVLPAMPLDLAASPAVPSIPGGTPILTAPDLTITSITATSPVNLSTRNNISITDTVANIGEYQAGSFVISYYFSPSNIFNPATAVLIGSRNVTGPLNAGANNTATTVFSVSPTAIPAGNYYVIGYADSTQLIAESNESNNMTSTSSTVQVSVADLAETAVSSPAIGTTLLPGATISVTDTVQNIGSAAAGAFSIYYFLVPSTGTGQQNFLGSRNVTSLAPGASSTATVSLKVPTTAYGGNFYIQAWANYTNTILESNLANDSYTNTSGIITVSPPDLAMTAVSETPTTVTRPGPISVTFTVVNEGLSFALPVNIGFYLSKTSTITESDQLVGNFTVPKGFAAGASYTATVSVSLSSKTVAAGTYYFGAYANYNNAIVETTTANNGLAASQEIVIH